MGTRNLTRVISNGQLKIEQYCQWDGYPTGRGSVVLAFARDLYKGGSVDELKDYLETTRLVNAKDNGCENSTYTGAPYDNHTSEVFEFVDDYARMHSHVSDRENVESMLDKGMITMKDAQRYIVASRDIGNDVLGFILKHKPEGMTFYTDDYLAEMPPQPGKITLTFTFTPGELLALLEEVNKRATDRVREIDWQKELEERILSVVMKYPHEDIEKNVPGSFGMQGSPYIDRQFQVACFLDNGADRDFLMLPCIDAELQRSARRLGSSFPYDLKVQIEDFTNHNRYEPEKNNPVRVHCQKRQDGDRSQGSRVHTEGLL